LCRLVTVVNAQWFGSEALELTYNDRVARSPTSCSTGTTSRPAAADSGRLAIAAVIRRRADYMVVPIAPSNFGIARQNDEIFYHLR
jgi:hypothetical protein